MKKNLTGHAMTATGRSMAYGVREEFGGGPLIGAVPAHELGGLIDAPQFCAAGSCHEGLDDLSGRVFVSIFGRERG